MTDALRRRHRRLVLALAVLVPPAFAAALTERPAPHPDPLPAPLVAVATAGPERWTRDDLWGPLEVRTRLLEPADADGGPVVELAPARDLRRPSVLVYWAPTGTPGALPVEGHLVGRLAGAEAGRFVLPAAARVRPGRLYLYSLGHHELVGSAALPPVSGAPAATP